MRNLRRNKKGIAIAEASSTFALLLPLTFLAVLAAIECCAAYIIHTNLTQAALQGANDLGVVWAAQNQPGQSLTTAQQQAVFNKVEIPHIIPFYSGSSNPNFLPAVFDFTGTVPSVTVTAVFIPGAQCLKFPGAYISSSFLSFSLPQTLTMRASCTFPLPNRTNHVGN